MGLYPTTKAGHRLGYARHFFHDHRAFLRIVHGPLPKYASVAQCPPVVYTLTPPVRDQGQLGDCVEFATTTLFTSTSLPGACPGYSPEELYYVYREAIGDIPDDCGSSVMGCLGVLQSSGVCLEQFNPYNPATFTQPPSAAALADAATHKPKAVSKIVTLDDIILQIANFQYGFVAGIAVYQSFEDAFNNGGAIPIPGQDEQLLGGHGIYVHDYDQDQRLFVCQNSWGTRSNGQVLGLPNNPGHFTLSFDYLLNPDLCWEMGTIQV